LPSVTFVTLFSAGSPCTQAVDASKLSAIVATTRRERANDTAGIIRPFAFIA
jgi:hypothetical protein